MKIAKSDFIRHAHFAPHLLVVFAIGAVTCTAFATLVPSALTSLTNDTLVGYQWGLQTQDQKILRDLTDITHQTLTGGHGNTADIDVDPLAVGQLMKRDVVVAVIDSGLDVNHPDLQGSILQSSAECDSGRIPFAPTQDKDGNGYIGDCMGWNFTARPGSTMQNNPVDDLGHGTHVAGIIAAKVNNQLGVSGVAPHILILPLKVTSAADNNVGLGVSTSVILVERVAKALQYAIDKRVDVINISMGWPAASDSPAIRALFQKAIDAGIVVVAAAGNNNNSSFNYPCAYPGVICVAANSINNQLSNMSNFGGHVDLAAPGEEIVSTYPTALTPAYISTQGYENLSGTSQASPYVAAAAAVLKGVQPGISVDEVAARLFAGSQELTPVDPLAKRKFIQFGTVKINRALRVAPQPMIVPSFKGLSRIVYRNADVSFVVPVKNYWLAQNEVGVSVRSLSPQLVLTTKDANHLLFTSGEVKALPINGRIQDFSADRTVTVEITIQYPLGDGTIARRQFIQQLDLTRDLNFDAQVLHVPVQLLASGSAELAKQNMLAVMDPNGVAKNPSYYWSSNEQGGVVAHLLGLQNNVFTESQVQLPEKTLLFLTATLVPMNHSTGYLLESRGFGADGKTGVFNFNFLDASMRPVPGVEVIQFVPETVVLDKDALTSLHFLQTTTVEGKDIPVPVFITQGNIPAADVDTDYFHFAQNTSARRVYFLWPEKQGNLWSYKTRNFDNYKFSAAIRQQLGLSFQDDLNLINLLPTSPDASDTVRILYSYGPHALQRFVVVEVRSTDLQAKTFHLQSTTVTSEFLAYGTMGSVIDLNAAPRRNSTANFGVFYTPTHANNFLLTPDGRQLQAQVSIDSASPQDLLIGLVQTYIRGNQSFSFAQSKSNLLLKVNSANGAGYTDQGSIRRATWPGVSSSDILYPSYWRNNDQWNPAIYIDATQMYENSVYFWTVTDQGHLYAPMGLNFNVPQGCRPLVPQKLAALGLEQSVMMACTSESRGFEIQLMPLQ